MGGGWLGKSVMAATLGIMAALAVLVAAQAATAHPADGRTASFELAVEGNPPKNATFFGKIPGKSVQLRDPDGDGVYTGGMFLHSRNYAPSEPIPVSIWGGTGETPSGTSPAQKLAGYPSLIIEDFGVQTIEDDEIFSGGISFAGGTGGSSADGGDLVGRYIAGTDGADHNLEGRAGDDLIVGRAGADLLNGKAGDDALYAAYDLPVSEAPNAPASPDLLSGGEGDDLIDAADAAGAPDTVYCGPGDDLVYADAEDVLGDDSCEAVERY